ncbi:MAG: transglutaminaseTgpA domain-containing protein [Egibacteraceae bacterium]
MTTLRERPSAPAATAPAAGRSRGFGRPGGGPLAAVVALVVTACLPLTRVYVGLAWARPVLAAALLAVGIAWACRRLGLGLAGSFTASAVGWLGFVVVAFLGDTLAGGLVPTFHTLRALSALWVRGTELARLQPSPTVAEPGLLLLSVTGVWAVAYVVEGMVFHLAVPVQAVITALVLWVTPLAIAKPGYAWGLAGAFLAASVWLLRACARADLARWGVRAGPARSLEGRGARDVPVAPLVIATAAITAGVIFARLLPGAVDPPWLQLRSVGGTTLTSNPIVDIKARLVSPDTRPVLRVRSPRPVYLRITSLDVYNGQREEWTSGGIRGAPVSGPLPNQEPATISEKVTVAVTVANVGPGAVLVPAPYLPVSVSGPVSETFQYDPRVATLTLDRNLVLSPGDQYRVTATIPAPPGEELDGIEPRRGGDATQLPEGIPPQVGQLAREISGSAGAQTPFAQALAIQDELRTWAYSLEPAPGHGGSAMASFLAAREGYCEQFAGTMAVMLRTLGIPARVAVGFTPGTPTASGEFVITNANAHAWVEAHFPRLGWIAFEPTPRSDGNVLVPSATNLAPHLPQTRPQGGGAPNDPPRADQPSQPDQDQLPGQSQPPDRPRTSAQAGTGADLGPEPPRTPQPSARIPLRALLLALVALTLGAVAGGVRSLRVRGASPTDRVLRARARSERLGRGLGVHRSATETDREYLARLAAKCSQPEVRSRAVPNATVLPSGRTDHPASERLARATAAACYAPTVTEAEADAAEHAAADLRHHLLDPLPIHLRLTAIVRGGVGTTLRALLDRIGGVTRVGDDR